MYKIYFSTEIVYINLFSSRKYLDIIFQLYHLGTFHVVGNTNSLGCVLKPKAVERAFKSENMDFVFILVDEHPIGA